MRRLHTILPKQSTKTIIDVVLTKYPETGVNAIVIFDDYGTPLITPTVDINCYDTEVVINNDGDNSGILEFLVSKNFIFEPHRKLPYKKDYVYVCRLKGVF
jgi:hypothetical protein